MNPLLHYFLLPFAWIYGSIMFFRNKMYDLQIKKSVTFDFPVISVGNLSVGGTGKTVLIEYLIGILKENYKIGVLSRGYKRSTSGYLLVDESMSARVTGDEMLQIKRKFPFTTVAVCEERVIGIPIMLLDSPELQVILLDDAFQHRQVKPGLSILLTDYSLPYSRDHLLPAGRLRENADGATRADVIIVTKSPLDLPLDQRIQLTNELAVKSDQQVIFSYLKYGSPYSFTDERKKLSFERNGVIVLVCGIANPGPLHNYLNEKVKEVQLLKFPDHYSYTMSDIRKIERKVSVLNGKKKLVITTEKDAVRLALFKDYLLNAGIEIFCIPVEMGFFEDDELRLNNLVQSFIFKNIPDDAN